MRNIVVTGAGGFIGRNLVQHLKALGDVNVLCYDLDDTAEALEAGLAAADFVFHLAGVNRPRETEEFETGNKGLTDQVLSLLVKYGRKIPFVLSSSAQAALDNPYGVSKRRAEAAVLAWARESGGEALVYRLPNVFGKWCRPNYNSVAATYCYNIARDLPIQINDPAAELTLVYIDDVAAEFLRALQGGADKHEDGFCHVPRVFQLTLRDLAGRIHSFRASRKTLTLPNFEDDLTRFLYATYLSYLPQEGFGYKIEMQRDNRGWLAELIKSKQFGQIFVSRTKPGITRGNHWHHTKTEKFIVIEGEAVIRFRRVGGEEIIEVPVSGEEIKIVDIPTGYTHSITNVGETDVITLFWADTLFDPENPDTVFLEV